MKAIVTTLLLTVEEALTSQVGPKLGVMVVALLSLQDCCVFPMMRMSPLVLTW